MGRILLSLSQAFGEGDFGKLTLAESGQTVMPEPKRVAVGIIGKNDLARLRRSSASVRKKLSAFSVSRNS